MANIEHLSITLPTEMARLIRHKVEEGLYASTSEVIREAIGAWQKAERSDLEDLLALRQEIEKADIDPRPSLTEADLDRHFTNRLARSSTTSKDHA